MNPISKGCLLALLACGCTAARQPSRNADVGELETDPLLHLGFEGATPRPLLKVGGDVRSHGNDSSVSRTWDFAPGAPIAAASILIKLRAAGLPFARVNCFPNGDVIASGLKAVSPTAGAGVTVDLSAAERFVRVRLDGQPALGTVSTSTPSVRACPDNVVQAVV